MKVFDWSPRGKGVFVTATDTEIGKTIVSGLLVQQLQQRGYSVGVMKPVASGGRMSQGKLVSTDAKYLKKISGVADPLEIINPICLRQPLAPLVAAEIDNSRIDLRRVWQAYRILQNKYKFLVVEGTGGLLVPVTKNIYMVDIAKRLGLPLVIVARPGLGTINHTLLTINYARMYGFKIEGVILNYAAPGKQGLAEKTNPKIIERLGKVKLLGIIPYQKVL